MSFLWSLVLSFPQYHVDEITKCITFSNWIHLLSKMHLRFLSPCHFVVWSFIFSVTEGCLGCLCVFIIMNKATVNIFIQFFLSRHTFWALCINTMEDDGWMVWQDYVWLCKKLPIIQMGCILLHSCLQWMRVPGALHTSPPLDVNVLDFGHLVCVQYHPIDV
jgi:hypothetical protein